MLLTQQEIDKRSREEQEWWNKFSEIMAMQWGLTPALNKVLRSALINEYSSFLFKQGGSLLDVGCGNGWISIQFAQKGMDVVGIDFSQEQIAQANKNKADRGLENIEFRTSNIVNINPEEFDRKFDSIVVNAFLHHLSEQEVQHVLSCLEKVLNDGGRIYLYEPVESIKRTSTYFIATFFYYLVMVSRSILFHKPIRYLALETSYYKRMEAEGYSGISPHEKPLRLDCILKSFSENIRLVHITPWHSFSLAYGMQLMVLKDKAQRWFARFTTLVFLIDRFLLKVLGWENVSTRLFIMCGLKFEKIQAKHLVS